MQESLKSRPTPKLPDLVRFRGRILFLTEDPGLIRSQLEGKDLDWDPSIKLRDDISTDEITPAYICYYYDETLGEFPYLGLKCGEEFPISAARCRQGGFVAAVSGKRRGKGSSREQSPYAEMMAGIRLVVAENIERIYRENCQNLGVFTSTDFGLIDRVRRGEAIPLSEFTRGEGDITRGIIEYGGLFQYNVARMQGKVAVPPPATGVRPMTLAEKIIARHWVTDLASGRIGVTAVRPGDEGFVRTDIRFSHEYVTPMSAIFLRDYVGKDEKVVDPGSIFFFRDHLTFLELAMTDARKAEGLLDVALELKKKQEEFAAEQGIRLYGELPRLGPNMKVSGLRGDLPLQDAGAARPAGPGDHRQRQPHAAQRRRGLPGLRGRHHGDLQFMADQGRAHQGSAVGADPGRRTEAGQRDGQGLHAPDPAASLRQERQGDRQDRGVCRRRGAGAVHR